MTKVITIDGASGTGKTTVCLEISKKLGYRLLLSGLLYRLVALYAKPGSELDFILRLDASKITILEQSGKPEILFEDKACYSDLMQPSIADKASKIAAMPAVRQALLPIQHAFKVGSGLVAEGRDMGSVVFPEAGLKIYLAASDCTRAKRRAEQLQLAGKNISIDELLAEMAKRDARDSSRSNAPLKCVEDSIVIDTSELTVNEVVQKIIELNVV